MLPESLPVIEVTPQPAVKQDQPFSLPPSFSAEQIFSTEQDDPALLDGEVAIWLKPASPPVAKTEEPKSGLEFDLALLTDNALADNPPEGFYSPAAVPPPSADRELERLLGPLPEIPFPADDDFASSLSGEDDFSALLEQSRSTLEQDESPFSSIAPLSDRNLAWDNFDDAVPVEEEPIPGRAEISPEDEQAVRLGLAKVYLELGDPPGARQALEEVLREGNTDQQREAQELLAKISVS